MKAGHNSKSNQHSKMLKYSFLYIETNIHYKWLVSKVKNKVKVTDFIVLTTVCLFYENFLESNFNPL